MSEVKKTLFDKISEILKTAIWPIIVLIVLFWYNKEFKKVIDNSTKVSIGSFSMEVQREATNQGFSELGKIITGLNETELKLLLSMSESQSFGFVGRNNKNYFLSGKIRNWEGLEKGGLVTFEGFTVDEVESYLMRLGAKKELRYYNPKGESMGAKERDFTEESYAIELDGSKVSNQDAMKLDSYMIKLSDKGKQAINIILKTLVESMNK